MKLVKVSLFVSSEEQDTANLGAIGRGFFNVGAKESLSIVCRRVPTPLLSSLVAKSHNKFEVFPLCLFPVSSYKTASKT